MSSCQMHVLILWAAREAPRLSRAARNAHPAWRCAPVTSCVSLQLCSLPACLSACPYSCELLRCLPFAPRCEGPTSLNIMPYACVQPPVYSRAGPGVPAYLAHVTAPCRTLKHPAVPCPESPTACDPSAGAAISTTLCMSTSLRCLRFTCAASAVRHMCHAVSCRTFLSSSNICTASSRVGVSTSPPRPSSRVHLARYSFSTSCAAVFERGFYGRTARVGQ